MMFWPLLLSAALADDQKLVYDLSLNGQKVGLRTVTVRYVPREDGERRVIEVYSELTVAGRVIKARSAATSSARSASFTTTVDDGGAASQVQGTALPTGGWRVTYADDKGVRDYTLSASEARLSSLDLLDPGRVAVLATPGAAGLLLAETGTTVAGTVEAGLPVTVRVGTQELAATRYLLRTSAGVARVELDPSGVLLHSEIAWLGGMVVAHLREPPAARDYGTIEAIPIGTGGVREEPL